jgi:hypothetical protein
MRYESDKEYQSRMDIFDKLGLEFKEDGTPYINKAGRLTTRLLYGIPSDRGAWKGKRIAWHARKSYLKAA